MQSNGELDDIKYNCLQGSRAGLRKRKAQKSRRLRTSSSESPNDDDNDEDDNGDESFKERKQSRKHKSLERSISATRVDVRNDDEEHIMDETDESSVSLHDDDKEVSSADSHQIVEERKESHKGKFLEQKKSATRVDFHSDGDNEIIEERGRDHWKAIPQITTNPAGKKSRKSQQKTYEGRRAWTETEIHAIKEGIATFGWGKWAQIKDYYNAILKNRTSSQIKVKHWRNE
jgi:hypothetical protein